jgi:hypothetical protein
MMQGLAELLILRGVEIYYLLHIRRDTYWRIKAISDDSACLLGGMPVRVGACNGHDGRG